MSNDRIFKGHRAPFPGSIMVAVRTGGVGKTLLAQVLHYLVFERLGYDLNLVSLDVPDEKSTSKLKKFLPETQDIRFAPSMSELMQDPAVSVGHFDQVAALLARPGHLLDLGANVSPVLFSWSEHAGIDPVYGRLQPITLVVPVVAHSQAIGDAITVIEDARRFAEFLPVNRVIVVYNERDGRFSGEIGGFVKLRAMEAMGGQGFVCSIRLPRLVSEIWKKVQDRQMSFSDVVRANPHTLGIEFGMTTMAAGRGRRDIMEWLEAAGSAFQAAGILP